MTGSTISQSALALDLAHPSMWPQPQPRDERDYARLGVDPVKTISAKKIKGTGLIPFIKRAFARLDELYSAHVPVRVREYVKWGREVAVRGYNLIEKIYDTVYPIFTALRFSSEASDNWFDKLESSEGYQTYMKWVRRARILSAFSLIEIGINLTKHIKGLAKAAQKGKLGNVAEASLELPGDFESLLTAADGIIAGLGAFDVISGQIASTVSTYLVGIGAIISLGTIALHTKHLVEGASLHGKIVKLYKGPSGQETRFDEVVDHVNGLSKKYLVRQFGVIDGGELKHRMKAIWERNKDQSKPASQENIKTAMKAMKNRLISKHVCNALRIFSGVISIVATAILLFTTLAPLGFTILAVATALVIAALIVDRVTTTQFEKTMKKLAPGEPHDFDPGGLKKEEWKFDYTDYMTTASVREQKWKNRGKKAFRGKIYRITNWKPSPRSANAL